MRTYQNIGTNGGTSNPPVNQIAVGRYVRDYANAPATIRNLAATHRKQATWQAIEAVHGEMAYPVQRFSRKQKRGLKTKTI